ncbi:hypothetical protein H3Z83_00830 [Tenacibaculum sp. S7007]|uniref:Uncharacterized protein n=1 Tax=Tenacibaculum pelagium TaxID=2759527 RepID=A0A839AL15_9FLAO|nr:hypothetical protein [Tenacibaculum pelagium]MBA6155070.1 hypothetical protein [Tenacibaculum pelagium]
MVKKKNNIQTWIAIVSIIVPILVTFFIKLIENENKELSIYFKQTEKVLIKKTTINNNIALSYDSINVENISIAEIIIENSGNTPLTKLDFEKEGFELIVTPNVKKNKNNTLPYLMDVTCSENAKQRGSELSFSSNEKNGVIEYLPSLLNKGDRVILEVYIPLDTKINLDYNGKIKGGMIKSPILYSDIKKTSKLEDLITSINNIFLFKYFTVILFALLFSTMIIGAISLESLSTNDTNKWSDMNIQSKFFMILMILFSLLFLILLIASVII